MKNFQPMRRLPLSGSFNTRDLGGFAAAGCRTTCWFKLYRSDSPAGLTAEDWEYLTDRGLCAVVDLRGKRETAARPVRTPAGVIYQPLPLRFHGKDLSVRGEAGIPHRADGSVALDDILEALIPDYAKTFQFSLAAVVQILHFLLEKLPHGGVLFHCSAGKDRTGIVAATVLFLCGVATDDIVADYAVSEIYNEKGVNRSMDHVSPQLLAVLPDPQIYYNCYRSMPATIKALLDAFERWNLPQTLNEAGFTYEEQEKLVALMTEPAEN